MGCDDVCSCSFGGLSVTDVLGYDFYGQTGLAVSRYCSKLDKGEFCGLGYQPQAVVFVNLTKRIICLFNL